jgi:hypothetical protein
VTHSSDINTPHGPHSGATRREDSVTTSDGSGEVSAARGSEDPSEATFVDQVGPSEDDAHDSVVIRKSERIREKVRAARAHLERLPKTDRRARLLHAAVVRRDEVLLDALLQELDGT